MTDQPARPCPRPCSACPYRRDVPAGIWAAEEYAKLPAYDAETWAQPPGAFHCHSAPDLICAGWAGCHDMTQTLAARIGVAHGCIDPAIYGYTTTVPLFASGAEAAAHGMSRLDDPTPAARTAQDRYLAAQARRTRKGPHHEIQVDMGARRNLP